MFDMTSGREARAYDFENQGMRSAQYGAVPVGGGSRLLYTYIAYMAGEYPIFGSRKPRISNGYRQFRHRASCASSGLSSFITSLF